jgi:hypothetical protein
VRGEGGGGGGEEGEGESVCKQVTSDRSGVKAVRGYPVAQGRCNVVDC